MGPDFINVYVERILKELTEYVKLKILLETQLQFLEKANTTLTEELEKYKKIEEKQTKRSQKIKEENSADNAREMSS